MSPSNGHGEFTFSPSKITSGVAFSALAVSSANEPSAAWIVALGSHAMAVNSFSLKFNPAPETASTEKAIRTTRPMMRTPMASPTVFRFTL